MPAPDSTELDLLCGSDLVIVGRMPWSSNGTFLCELWPAGSRPDGGITDGAVAAGVVTDGDVDGDHVDAGPLGRAVYKPHQGERPLWDFPDGLYKREVGAYTLASALGWDVVPPTVERNGPFGVGSVQWFVDADFDQHYFTLLEDQSTHPQLRRMCAYDLVANSTDRKGGHVLIDDDGHLWGIDNGLILHAEFKLRSVIWDFAGEPLPGDLADDLAAFIERPLPADLAGILDPFEHDALYARARALLAEGRLPTDPTGRRFPWPLV